MNLFPSFPLWKGKEKSPFVEVKIEKSYRSFFLSVQVISCIEGYAMEYLISSLENALISSSTSWKLDVAVISLYCERHFS